MMMIDDGKQSMSGSKGREMVRRRRRKRSSVYQCDAWVSISAMRRLQWSLGKAV